MKHRLLAKYRELILAEVRAGKTLSSIAREIALHDPEMTPRTIYALTEESTFYQQYQSAKKIRADARADQVFDESAAANESNVQSQRLKIDVQKWGAAVDNPEAFGSRTKVVGDANQPIAFIIDTGIRRDPVSPEDATEVPPTRLPKTEDVSS